MVADGDSSVLATEQGGVWYRLPAQQVASSRKRLSILDVLADTQHASTDSVVSAARPLPPIVPPRNVLCLGKNYPEHAKEFAAYARESDAVPDAPIVFTKAVDALCGAHDDIVVDSLVTAALDYEVELAIVIGRGGYAITNEDVARHIAGYTVLNDITARDLQQRHRQWFLGKSLPKATPVGPVVVSPDEFDNLAARRIRSWVNGELRQDDVLGSMIFGVAETISTISRVVPLEAGDLIAMGTPSGVGLSFDPPRFLQDGDRVVCEIEGVGRLDNTVRFAPAFSELIEEGARV